MFGNFENLVGLESSFQALSIGTSYMVVEHTIYYSHDKYTFKNP